MARKSIPLPTDDEDPGLDISSLIDVCFLLLSYFIVTSTIKRKEQDLMMALPGGLDSNPDQSVIPPMFIKVDNANNVSVNSGAAAELLDQGVENRQLPLLSDRLRMYASAANAAGNKALVQIQVENEAHQQAVINVLNALSRFNITNVTFTDL